MSIQGLTPSSPIPTMFFILVHSTNHPFNHSRKAPYWEITALPDGSKQMMETLREARVVVQTVITTTNKRFKRKKYMYGYIRGILMGKKRSMSLKITHNTWEAKASATMYGESSPKAPPQKRDAISYLEFLVSNTSLH